MMLQGDSLPDKMVISLAGKQALYKGDLMMLEMIANCNWTRPLYVAVTVGKENFMNLGDNFVQEGLANRITPYSTNRPGMKNFDADKTYDIVMNRFKWGGLATRGIYLDENVMRMCYTHRRLMGTLALELINEGKKDKALKVLQKAEKVIPAYNVPMNYMSGALDFAQAYLALGYKQKALDILNGLWKNSQQYANWYLSLSDRGFNMSQQDCFMHFQMMMSEIQLASQFNKSWASQHNAQLQGMMQQYQMKGGQMPQTGAQDAQ